MEEILKQLEENENYAISNLGVVYYVRGGRKRPIKPNCRGEVKLSMGNGKYKNFVIGRLVANHFIPNPDGCRYIHRKDGNVLNNSADNLYWYDMKFNKLVTVTTPNGEVLNFETMSKAADYFGITLQTLSTCVSRNGYYKKHKVERIKG